MTGGHCMNEFYESCKFKLGFFPRERGLKNGGDK